MSKEYEVSEDEVVRSLKLTEQLFSKSEELSSFEMLMATHANLQTALLMQILSELKK